MQLLALGVTACLLLHCEQQHGKRPPSMAQVPAYSYLLGHAGRSALQLVALLSLQRHMILPWQKSSVHLTCFHSLPCK